MSITIDESGLQFGANNNADIFHIENSHIYKSLGDSVSTIEFILYKENHSILMIEAKSSSPQPSNRKDFDGFIDEIYVKFAHSIDLFFSIIVKRLKDNHNEMPDNFKTVDYANAKIKLLLVINGHSIKWLAPISEALTRRLKMQLKTWRLEVAVLNNELAADYGLLKQ